ncbi:unnamed protein product [Didymodactylos carnosus]|uniref:Uncharacterized protein n=1 Tax=Didymodactylos carnosus TaxID=1234261 RepID=A0A814R433_9BILA|nr:unnamed protein product [Didymodactylos carnosus]CAF3891513.1 unnamed protein product [Didymodactylos carnosus]
MPGYRVVGGHGYTVARGWVRFGLKVTTSTDTTIWKQRGTCYHGTNNKTSRSIISIGHLLLPGDKLLDNTVVESVYGSKDYFYTSPSTAYTASRLFRFKHNYISKNSGMYKVQLILRCKQKPGTFQRHSVVIPITDPYISSDIIEWYSSIATAAIPYSAMVRIRKAK